MLSFVDSTSERDIQWQFEDIHLSACAFLGEDQS